MFLFACLFVFLKAQVLAKDAEIAELKEQLNPGSVAKQVEIKEVDFDAIAI